MQTIRLITLLLVTLTAAVAQAECPMLRAEQVGPELRHLGQLTCSGGITIQMQGVTLAPATRFCPMSVIISPTHDRPVKTENRTYVKELRNVPEILFTYDCATSWLVFIPLGKYCRQTSARSIGGVPFLDTLGCNLSN